MTRLCPKGLHDISKIPVDPERPIFILDYIKKTEEINDSVFCVKCMWELVQNILKATIGEIKDEN